MVMAVALRSTTFQTGTMPKHERSLDGGASPSTGPSRELPAGDRSFVAEPVADAREALGLRGGCVAAGGGSR